MLKESKGILVRLQSGELNIQNLKRRAPRAIWPLSAVACPVEVTGVVGDASQVALHIPTRLQLTLVVHRQSKPA